MLGAGVGLPGWARRRRAPRAARAASRRETLPGLPDIGELLARYSELEPGFTDAAIVWLAGRTRCRAFLTVETRDFGIYRIEGGKRFEVVKWFD